MNKPDTPLMTRLIDKALKPVFMLTMAAVMAGAASISASEPEPQRWFQVDVVVFVNQNSMNGQEQWPEITHHTIPGNAIKLRNPDAPSSAPGITDLLNLKNPNVKRKPLPDLERDAFVDLPREAHMLLQQGNRMDAASGYKVISRKAWIMPLEGDSTSKPIKIREYNNSGKPSLLEGSIQISSSRFLHADVNLWYSELAREALSSQTRDEEEMLEDDEETSSSQKPRSTKPVIRRDLQLVMDPSGTPMKMTRNFQLRESRRIRNSQQIQYLDSPVLGVLIKLTPYERPEEPLLPELDAFSNPEPVLGLLPGVQG